MTTGVQTLFWPLASMVHMVMGLLLLLSIEIVYIVLLVFGVAHVPTRIGKPLAFLLAALRHFAVIAALALGALALHALLDINRHSAETAVRLSIALLVFDCAIIFIVLRWLRKKIFPARLKAPGYSCH